MGGQAQVGGWQSLDDVTAAVQAIPGLAPQERIDLSAAMHRAIERETDLGRKLAIAGKLKGIVEGAAKSGISGAIAAAIAAVTG